jgi:glycosyltransferase involved in cell wall biosynthesis
MRIGIDARKIRDFGIGAYIRNLLTYLPDYDRDNEYVIFHYPADRDVLPPPTANFRLVPETAPKYSLRELLALPLQMRRQRLDLFHAPHYTLPPLRPCAGIVTIHDVIHLRFPEYLPHPAAAYYAKGLMWAAAHSARRILTVSECSKRDIRAYLGVSDSKIAVVYNGIDADMGTVRDRDALAAQFGIAREYILYLGNFMPHKNLDTLIRAYVLLKERQRDLPCLVLAGKADRMRARLERLIANERLGRDVVLTGFVPDAWVASLYAHAALFVYPSLYEGFGLQVLEAMAQQTPVVIADAAALPEIAGEAAARFNPRSAEHLADTLEHVLSDATFRATLIAKGRQRVQAFAWRETARQTAASYRQALASSA